MLVCIDKKQNRRGHKNRKTKSIGNGKWKAHKQFDLAHPNKVLLISGHFFLLLLFFSFRNCVILTALLSLSSGERIGSSEKKWKKV